MRAPHQVVAATLIVLSVMWAQSARAADGPEPIAELLWPDGAPGAAGETELDRPRITVYRPKAETANGAAVVICPGGGYAMLAKGHEGKQVADWLNSIGVTGVVLEYRLAPRYRHPAMLQDVQRAIRTVRARAMEWAIDAKRVAVLGFSAGGHLASTAATHFDAGNRDATDPIDRQSSRPDLVILGYPVIAIATEHGHTGSRDNLLGPMPAKELVESLSNETQVTKDTPPAFIVHTNEDNGVVPENSLLFVLALRKVGVPVEFHLFEKGRHGLGLGGGSAEFKIPEEPSFKVWPGLCETWMKGRGFLTK
jgi:acetyl esterase/lipase